RSYHLEVVQQPVRTAEFGNASLSRLPITPPIIVKLTVTDRSGNAVIPQHELPFLIAHLSLWTEDGRTRVDAGQGVPMLYGNLVSAVDQLEDMAGNQGLFFCFPDVSVRVRGRYQLGVTLMRISRQARCPAARRDAEAHQDGRVRRSQPGGERARPCRDALSAV
ncbi:velvet factor-domain-containing protein, partial [Schizophyllum commune]